jgi:hypothetical protein
MKGSLLTSDIEKDKLMRLAKSSSRHCRKSIQQSLKMRTLVAGGHQALLIKFQNALYSRAHLSTNPLRRGFYLTVLYEAVSYKPAASSTAEIV